MSYIFFIKVCIAIKAFGKDAEPKMWDGFIQSL